MQTKAQTLTDITLSIFKLNGLQIEWGDDLSEPYRLSSAKWQVMGAIYLANTPSNTPQIAQMMGLTRQGVQKQIHFLLNDGLIEALPNPHNKRSPLYILTQKGETVYLGLQDNWQTHISQLSHQLDAEELKTTLKTLSHLINTYSHLNQTKGNES